MASQGEWELVRPPDAGRQEQDSEHPQRHSKAAQARSRVDPLVRDHHWDEGQRLSIEDAMLLALRSTS